MRHSTPYWTLQRTPLTSLYEYADTSTKNDHSSAHTKLYNKILKILKNLSNFCSKNVCARTAYYAELSWAVTRRFHEMSEWNLHQPEVLFPSLSPQRSPCWPFRQFFVAVSPLLLSLPSLFLLCPTMQLNGSVITWSKYYEQQETDQLVFDGTSALIYVTLRWAAREQKLMHFMLLSTTVLITTFHILPHLVLAVTLKIFSLGLSDVSKVKKRHAWSLL